MARVISRTPETGNDSLTDLAILLIIPDILSLTARILIRLPNVKDNLQQLSQHLIYIAIFVGIGVNATHNAGRSRILK